MKSLQLVGPQGGAQARGAGRGRRRRQRFGPRPQPRRELRGEAIRDRAPSELERVEPDRFTLERRRARPSRGQARLREGRLRPGVDGDLQPSPTLARQAHEFPAGPQQQGQLRPR